jgi:hypothetical protein
MKRFYWLFLMSALMLQGCGDIEWFPENNTSNSSSTQPTLTMAFNPSTIDTSSASTLTFTIKNATGNPAQSGLGFTDQLDSSLSIAVDFSQCGGHAVKSGSKIIFDGGALAAGTASCTITATVSGATPGSFTNKASDITGLTGGLANGASNQTLSITAAPTTAPTLTKAYQPAAILAGDSTTLAFTITNQTGNPAQSGMGFTDTLDAGLSATAEPNQCGGTVSAAGAQISFTGGQLATGVGSCTINATVTGTTPGSYTNGATDISGLAGGLLNGVTDQTLAVSSSSVSDPTGVVTISIQDVTPPTDTSGTVVTFTATVNSNNSSANNLNVTIGFVGVDSTGNDLPSTVNFADATGLTPGQLTFTVPLDAPTSELANIAFWRITEVTINP